MTNLDDGTAVQRFDRLGMLGHLIGLPDQIRSAWRLASTIAYPSAYREPSAIVILGMGGSAIGGDLVRTIAAPHLPVPMLVVRDYDLPQFVGPKTLVFASSYSGNTEETLSGFEEARRRGAMIVVITTGGDLLSRAQTAGFPWLRFQYSAQPRAVLGYSVVLLLGSLCHLGLLPDQAEHIRETADLLENIRTELEPDVPVASNLAKQLAVFLHGKLPVIYGGWLIEVARRWKGQLNENSKSYAAFDGFPELNHNVVVGYQKPDDLRDRIAVVTLASDLDHPRVRARQQVTDELLDRSGIPHRTVKARGKSALAQMFSADYVGDFVSYYLALLYGVDPTPIEAIDYLKSRLAQFGG